MKLYIETMGCAMNTRDSEHMVGELGKVGYTQTSEPSEADLILINTCSVREKPERKLFSEIGQFAKIKKPGAKIGVCGCTASHMGEQILKKAPSVNFVLGARNVSKISQIIKQNKAVAIDLDHDDSTYVFESQTSSHIKALLNISIGCDKHCTYCIVPHTRGKEISIPMDLLLREAEKLAKMGVKELLLLGQNVNNYGARFSTDHPKVSFTALLENLSQIEGIKRIRFTSPHPLHMDNAFLECFATNPKVCKSIHIPLQSGSNAILKAMKRGYSREWYLDRIARLKALVPEVGISTDIIVGFPGETPKDFEDTLDILEQVRFDTLYSFIYSPRPLTPSYTWENKVPKEEASVHLERLQSRHKEILEQKAKGELGKTHEVLVEKIAQGVAEGRSDNGRLLSFEAGKACVGDFVRVEVIAHHKGSLKGRLARV
ncbi:(dimethylallyl)adenosine tRNA methylthiotransferase MiaB [Helicobacter ailurogastricus]|uniref:tRNA (N6-isopentenyl adenosine(37)-C2)-methylthiotransferase MiaB n=1 Tax=Helicobacter ailurogastricus TaxID=1578720 RepID=UPI00244D8CAE|nr:tRNA (N6-isopentenyl adenosine(37)-C2)-methylthiotransferase MiaB [Helicobacter ailurogastricus]GMB89354.1 (dimethylallyl)adenosine tRNA methylthiotransferase MiaB [Helicobacter ailurogastricus]